MIANVIYFLSSRFLVKKLNFSHYKKRTRESDIWGREVRRGEDERKVC